MPEKWTEEQKKAIDHKSGAAIVAASAGSGKTAVLVERVIKLLTDTSDPLDPSALAVVTFTEKAAAEMKSRCFASIAEKAKNADPKTAEFLRRQSKKLRNAKISTISSFCFTIIRENIDLSDFSAGFSIIDEISARLLKEKVLDDTLENFFTAASPEEKLLISDHFISRSDAELKKAVLKIYDFSAARKDPEQWLTSCENDDFAQVCRIEATEAAKDNFDCLKKIYERLCKGYESENNPKYDEDAKKIKETLIAFAEELAAVNFCPDEPITEKPSAPRAPSNLPEGIKGIRDRLKDNFDSLCGKCSALAVFDEENAEFAKVTKILVRIVREFSAAYKNEKLSRNTADFSDAEQGVYKILCEHPEVSERMGLKAVIVDEFQDSNELQYEIFRRLSDDGKNLYLVGDIKQSIYAFRGAEPSVFANILEDDSFTKLPMNGNFRSGKNIIDGVNEIFSRLMTRTVGGTNYKTDDLLVFGRDKVGDNSPIEICNIVTDKNEPESTAAEARYVASRIRSMIDEGYAVDGRPCKEEDFAIIIRNAGKKIPDYKKALAEFSLSACTDSKESFTDIPEVSIMLDFLAVTDDPYNDEPLARVLMSPIFALDVEEMSRLRSGTVGLDIKKLAEKAPDVLNALKNNYVRRPLYTCLNTAASSLAAASAGDRLKELIDEDDTLFDSGKTKKYSDILTVLRRLRSAMQVSTPGELVRTIYNTTDTLEVLCASENFESRLANLHLLESYAERFSENTSGGNIADFLADLDRLAENNKAPAGAGTSASGGVRIITAHGSKGLQYPICFVSNCQSKFNTNDTKENIILSKKYGIAGKIVRKRFMSKTPSPTFSMIKAEMEKDQKSEEMRLMYVAATRAKERLIFTGHTKKPIELEGGSEKGPDASADCNMLAWLVSLLGCCDGTNAMTDDGSGCYRFCGRLLYRNCTEPDEISAALPESETVVIAADEEEKERIKSAMQKEYTDPVFTYTACKFTATELVRNRKLSRGSTKNCELYISRPNFSEEKKKLKGKARGDAYHKAMENMPLEDVLLAGNAYHKAMEHMPFDDILSESGTAEALDKMLQNGILSEAERECIDPADIAKFFSCDEAKRMVKSGTVRRECPIFHRLDIDMVSAYELGLEKDEDISVLKKDPPYIQGIADLFFVEDDGIIIIDYKTDNVSDASELAKEYGFQLDIYADALSQMLSLPVKQKLIYSFKFGRMIDADAVRSRNG